MPSKKAVIKQSISCMVSAILILSTFFFFPALAHADTSLKESSLFVENDNLSDAQIDVRFKEIYSSYEIGEAFIASDIDFVKRYATSAKGNGLKASNGFDVVQSYAGTTVRFSGSVYHSGIVSYTYGGTVDATRIAGITPSSMTAGIQCVSFGVVGSDGWGIIYSGEFSYSTYYSDYISLSGSRSYLGYMLAYQLTPYCVVNTPNGSFTM